MPTRAAAVRTPLTSFVGRELEIDRVTALLRDSAVRLITLPGPAGIGEMRLASHVAEALSGNSPTRL